MFKYFLRCKKWVKKKWKNSTGFLHDICLSGVQLEGGSAWKGDQHCWTVVPLPYISFISIWEELSPLSQNCFEQGRMRQAVDTWAIRAISDGDVRQYCLSVCFTVINVYHLKYNKGPDAQLVPDIYPPLPQLEQIQCLYREYTYIYIIIDIYNCCWFWGPSYVHEMWIHCLPHLHGIVSHCAHTALRSQTGSWKEGPKYLNKILLLNIFHECLLFQRQTVKIILFLTC